MHAGMAFHQEMRNMKESLKMPCNVTCRTVTISAIAIIMLLALSARPAFGATKMATSSLFLHTSHEKYAAVDSVSKKRIVIPASYSNCFVNPSVTGDPKINSEKVTYSASGALTTCTSANKLIDADGAKSYPDSYTDDKFYVFDLNKAAKNGTTNTVWIRNMALYDNEKELTDNSMSKWSLYDLKISYKPVESSNYWINTSKTRSCRFLFVGKSLSPKLGIYGVSRCDITFEYYEAGTDNLKTLSSYLTYYDLDCGQGIWMRKALPAPSGMTGPTYVAVAQNSGLGYTVQTSGNKVIRQLTSESHDGIIQDAVGIYFSANKLVLGVSSNYYDSKYTGAFAGFGSSRKSMADREPNSLYEWIETENNLSEGMFNAVLSQYDEMFTYNIQHVVADGYESGAFFNSYVLTSQLPSFASAADDIRIISGTTDVTSRFDIDISDDNVLTVTAKPDSLGAKSFYNNVYTVKVPMRINDVSELNSYDELASQLGAEINADEGSIRWSNKSVISIETKTGQTYSSLESNEVACKAFFPVGTETLKAPGRTSINSRITVRGTVVIPYRFAFESVSILNRNRKVKGVLFYITDKDGRIIESTKTAGKCIEDTGTDMNESCRDLSYRYQAVMDIAVPKGEYYTCMLTEYECMYNNNVSIHESIVRKPLLVQAYPSEGGNGIRYIDNNVSLSKSIWAEGDRKNLLETILLNSNPEIIQ